MAKTEKGHGNGVIDIVTITAEIVFLASIAMISLCVIAALCCADRTAD